MNKNEDYLHRYVQPTQPKSGYRFVTAGALKRNYGGFCAYVKYKGGPNKVFVKHRTMSHIWYVCPDREIIIVRDNLSPDAFHPYGDSFDECVDFSMFNDSMSKAMGIEYHMTNFTHNPKAINRRNDMRTHPDSRIQVLSDSGGLQLVVRKDKSLVINPRELVEFYNNNVDAGMVLDVPLAIADEKTTLRAARLQKMNSDLMLKHAADGLEFFNIMHGHNDYERSKYREIVEDERINRLALGGVQFNSMLSAVSLIYDSILSSFHYKQYHILGVFLAPYLPLLVKLANEGDAPPHITSDSTSHIQSAANHAYHFQFDISSTSKRLPIGTRSAVTNSARILPCQCVICSTLKYTDILGHGDGRHTTELLAVHNAYEMARYTKQLQEACTSLSRKEYNQLVRTQLGKHPQLKEFNACLDFIEIATDKGIKAARAKYSSSLNQRKRVSTPVALGKNLWGVASKSVSDEQQAHVLQLMDKMEKVVKDQS